MTKQTHKVATDALDTLGTVIDERAGRDAIHLAVEPVIAAETLYPGQDIGLICGKASTQAAKKVGIVDPFLKGKVYPGDRFWLVVYPRQITSLRHVWEHPDVPLTTQPSSENAEAEQWLRDFANSRGVDYDEMMRHAKDYVLHGDYWSEGGRFEGEHVPEEFWDHYEAVTGVRVETNDRGSFFSCSC